MLFLYNMIIVDINAFRKNLKKYLVTPCQVTRYGIVIASIVPTGIGKLDEETLLKKANRGAKEFNKYFSGPPESLDPTPLGMKKIQTVYFEGQKHVIDENGKEVK